MQLLKKIVVAWLFFLFSKIITMEVKKTSIKVFTFQ
jgi:hypothetical protein